MKKIEDFILKALDNEIVANFVKIFVLLGLPIIAIIVSNMVLTYIDKM